MQRSLDGAEDEAVKTLSTKSHLAPSCAFLFSLGWHLHRRLSQRRDSCCAVFIVTAASLTCFSAGKSRMSRLLRLSSTRADSWILHRVDPRIFSVQHTADWVKLISKVVQHSQDEWGQLFFLCHSARATCTLLSCDSAALCWKEVANFLNTTSSSVTQCRVHQMDYSCWKKELDEKHPSPFEFLSPLLSSPVLVSSVRLDVSHYYFPSAARLVPSHALMMLFAKWIMWFHTAGWERRPASAR